MTEVAAAIKTAIDGGLLGLAIMMAVAIIIVGIAFVYLVKLVSSVHRQHVELEERHLKLQKELNDTENRHIDELALLRKGIDRQTANIEEQTKSVTSTNASLVTSIGQNTAELTSVKASISNLVAAQQLVMQGMVGVGDNMRQAYEQSSTKMIEMITGKIDSTAMDVKSLLEKGFTDHATNIVDMRQELVTSLRSLPEDVHKRMAPDLLQIVSEFKTLGKLLDELTKTRLTEYSETLAEIRKVGAALLNLESRVVEIVVRSDVSPTVPVEATS